ncbi:MAG TPA: hypothetical protein VKA84_17945 [Gemmatimonadaceae bacterium]|nr:hypothetical protein [Gemmatimonadaceae bacterium]
MSNAERKPEEQQVADLPEQDVTPAQEDAVKGGGVIMEDRPSPTATTSSSPLGTLSARFFQEVNE